MDQFATNLFGVIKVNNAILLHFRGKKSGTVVFLGSSGGIEGEPEAGAYCATKFALEGTFECFKIETADFNIRSFLF
ncbi:hypothetical protein BJ878DRAFT_529270 [Calycina marina]|uniref:Uncharacterized protein n=1 Tax=Calycina marina TaxID=1763456 RepID=A0A9P8CC73_9HELO|nr:hypothetical protein BJ878DRAFT_529270 [Calycina marina]